MTIQYIEPEWEEISPEGKDLVKKLLTYDPNSRISAADALQHPWIRMHAEDEKLEKSIATKALGNLRNFRVTPKVIFNLIRAMQSLNKPHWLI